MGIVRESCEELGRSVGIVRESCEELGRSVGIVRGWCEELGRIVGRISWGHFSRDRMRLKNPSLKIFKRHDIELQEPGPKDQEKASLELRLMVTLFFAHLLFNRDDQ